MYHNLKGIKYLSLNATPYIPVQGYPISVWHCQLPFPWHNFQCYCPKQLPPKTREGGDNGLFITLVLKVFNVFLFVGLTTLEFVLNFDWLVHLVKCPNVSATSVSSLEMYIN